MADKNPFQEAVASIGKMAPFHFAVNFLPSPRGGKGVFLAGDPGEVMREGVRLCREAFFVPVAERFETVVVRIPPSKGVNLYQASRGVTYVALNESPPIYPGGTIILDAPCPEGFGLGEGERAFARRLFSGRLKMGEIMRSSEDLPLSGGEQRAFLLSMAMERFSVRMVLSTGKKTGLNPAELRALGIEVDGTVESALKKVLKETESSRGLLVEDPFLTVPVYRG